MANLNPLDFVIMEVQDTVVGYESFNEDAKEKLLTVPGFSRLPASLQDQVIGQVVLIEPCLVAEVDGSAILVRSDWGATLFGDSLDQCIATLVKYRNAIAAKLEATVTGELLEPFVESPGPLKEQVIKRKRRRRLRDWVGKVIWILAGALIGRILTMIAGG